MTYQETLDYLFTTLPMFSRIGAPAYKKDLTNTILLCNKLGNPEKDLRCIHVAGTNGKGSVSHMLAAIYQSAGYKTGLYTSPHLYDFRERIRIDGEMIDKNFVVQFTERMKTSMTEIQPSFFETTVAMAFEWFRVNKVDLAIIETGLGGRLDSTNVVMPEVAVITNIGWDHTNLLGDTLEKIAGEKAGIIKEHTPVVIGEFLPETKKVFEQTAMEKEAALFYAPDRFAIEDFTWEGDFLQVAVLDKAADAISTYRLDLPGKYQLKNILTVLQTLLVAKEFPVNVQAVREGLSNVKKLTGLHGRWERIHEQPDVILEVAHNADGINALRAHLAGLHYPGIHLVIGVVGDKDLEPFLNALPKDAQYYFTQAGIPRALPATDLQKAAALHGINGDAYAKVDEAMAAAFEMARPEDVIIVCGSIFLVAEVNRESIAKLT